MPDTMTGELYAMVYAMCVKTCHLFAYDGLDCFALPCDVMYKIWSINLYIVTVNHALFPKKITLKKALSTKYVILTF